MKLRQLSGPQSLHETPLVAIEIAGEKHHLRFDMRAVGRLEAELDRGILEIWQSLIDRSFSVRMVLAIVAAGIAHEYKRGQEPTWEDVGAQLTELADINPLTALSLEALMPALKGRTDNGPVATDPNPAAPAVTE